MFQESYHEKVNGSFLHFFLNNGSRSSGKYLRNVRKASSLFVGNGFVCEHVSGPVRRSTGF